MENTTFSFLICMGSHPWDVSRWISGLNITEYRLSTTSWCCRPGNGQKAGSQKHHPWAAGRIRSCAYLTPATESSGHPKAQQAHLHVYASAVPQSRSVKMEHRLGLRQLNYQRQQQNKGWKVLALISRCKVQGAGDCGHNSPYNWLDINKHGLSIRFIEKPQTKPMHSFCFRSEHFTHLYQKSNWKWTHYTMMRSNNFWIKPYSVVPKHRVQFQCPGQHSPAQKAVLFQDFCKELFADRY